MQPEKGVTLNNIARDLHVAPEELSIWFCPSADTLARIASTKPPAQLSFPYF